MVIKRSGTAHARVVAQVSVLVASGLWVSAQANPVGAASAAAPNPTTDPCKATVLKFERTLAFIRETQGNKAGEDLKEKLLPAKLQSEILFKDGYCGLARYIKENRLDR